jgi:hypothetical protein
MTILYTKATLMQNRLMSNGADFFEQRDGNQEVIMDFLSKAAAGNRLL